MIYEIFLPKAFDYNEIWNEYIQQSNERIGTLRRSRIAQTILIIWITLIITISALTGYANDRRIKVGIAHNPFFAFKVNGGYSGLSVDVLEHIASEEDWGLQYKDCPWAECLEMLERGETDIQVFIAYSDKRAERFDFTEETLFNNWGQVYIRPDSGIETILDMEGKTVSVVKKSIHTSAFKRLLSSFRINSDLIEVDDSHSALRLANEGKANAVVTSRTWGILHAKEYNTQETSIIFNPIEIRYATPKGKNLALRIVIDKHLKALKEDKNSVLYKSLDDLIGKVGVRKIPTWIKWSLATGSGLLFLFVFITLLLRYRVGQKTKEITERKQIEMELRESEERLRSFYNAAFEGIAITEQGKLVDANRQFIELFGYEHDQLIDKEIIQLVAEEDRGLVLSNIRSGFDKPYEHKALHRDGSILNVEVHGQQIQFQGRPARVTAIHDLTERKQAEKALLESESRYRSLFKNNHTVMLVIDPKNGDILDANPAAISYYGWSYEELTAKKISDINMLTEEQVFQEMEKAKSDQRRHFIFQHRLSNGDIRDVEVYSDPLKLRGQNLLYSIIHDITDRKQAEEEREKLINDLQEAIKEIKTLRGILPLCSFCKKIRDDKGYWEQVDVYIHKYSQADISHSICPDCMKEHYPEV